MNENVCRLCRRYGGRSSRGLTRGWTCAKVLKQSQSEVVPGFLYYERDGLHPMMPERKLPPEWCERPLEQVVLEPDAAVKLRGDAFLRYDGNAAARMHLEERNNKEW